MLLFRVLLGIRRSNLNLKGYVSSMKHDASYSTANKKLPLHARELIRPQKRNRLKKGLSRMEQFSPCKAEVAMQLKDNTRNQLHLLLRSAMNDMRHNDKQVEGKIIKALHDSDRSTASSLLENHTLSPTSAIEILRCCAELPDPIFALQTWNVMLQKNISPKACCYTLMIESLCKGGYLEEAYNLLNFPGEGFTFCANLEVYNVLLRACVEKRSLSCVNRCLELMEERMVGKNEDTYFELLKMAVCEQDLSLVKQIWDDYRRQFSSTIISLQKFISAFSSLGDVDSAYQNLEHMVETIIHEIDGVIDKNVVRYSKVDIPVPVNGSMHRMENDKVVEHDTSTIGLCPRPVTDGKCAFFGIKSAAEGKLAQYQGSVNSKLLVCAFRDIMHACLANKTYELIDMLMFQLQYLGLQPTAEIYHACIKAILKVKTIGEALELLKVMQQRNVPVKNSSLAAISIACSDNSELDLAEALIDQISNYSSPYHINQFMAACDRMDLPERAIRAFKKMRERNIRPNVRTYEVLFSLFGNVNAPYDEGSTLSQADSMKRLNAIEMDMARNDIQHNHWSIMYMIKALAAEGMVKELRLYVRKAEGIFRFIQRNDEGVLVYNALIHALIKAKQNHQAILTFNNMRSNGFQPNEASCCIMIYLSSLFRCYNSACAMVSLMLRHGYELQNAAYACLIKFGELKDALKLLDVMSSENIQPNLHVYNTLLKKAISKGRLDMAEHLLEKMHRSKIRPDLITCNLVFSGYCRKGYHSTALEALQVLSLRMAGVGESISLEELKRCGDEYVFAEDSAAEIRLIERLDDSNDSVVFALLNLRLCCVLGSPICWHSDRSLWAARASQNYQRESLHAIC